MPWYVRITNFALQSLLLHPFHMYTLIKSSPIVIETLWETAKKDNYVAGEFRTYL